MTAAQGWGKRARRAPMRRVLALLLLRPRAGAGAGRGQGPALRHRRAGFGRLVLNFPDRLDLPAYKIRYDNGVLAVEFDEPIDAVAARTSPSTLPDYVTIAPRRSRPEGRPLRAADDAQHQHLEAGEKLFIDLMPLTWQGLPPGLPPEVVAELCRSAPRTRQCSPSSSARPRRRSGSSRWRPCASAATRPSSASSSTGASTTEGDVRSRRHDAPTSISTGRCRSISTRSRPTCRPSCSASRTASAPTARGSLSRSPRASSRASTRSRRPQFIVDIDIVPAEPDATLDARRARRRSRRRRTPPRPPRPVTTMAGGARACRRPTVVPYVTRRRQHGAAGRSRSSATRRRRVPPRRQRLDAVRHATVSIAEPLNLATLTPIASGFSVARRRRHAGRAPRPHHRAARDARLRGALLGAVARRYAAQRRPSRSPSTAAATRRRSSR